MNKIPTMNFVYTAILACLPFITTAQLCPSIDNIEILPAVPTSGDNIKIVTTVTTPYQGAILYSTYSMSGNTIDIEACYYSGLLTATQTYYDTLEIGMLSAGSYGIDFKAYKSSDNAICNYVDSNATSIGFSLTVGIDDLTFGSTEIGRIYPNPSSGKFAIELPEQVNATHIRIHSISGKMVHQGVFKKEMNLKLEAGSYFVEFLEDESTVGYQRLTIH